MGGLYAHVSLGCFGRVVSLTGVGPVVPDPAAVAARHRGAGRALPQSPTHRQVAPPADFHRASVTFGKPVGQFENSSDVGGPLVPSTASYDPASKTYTISAAGYNIWYQRDEFHYLWKKMSGDAPLAASVQWSSMDDFHDRKVALVIRDSLDDDFREIVAAQHGNGMVHIAWRGEQTGRRPISPTAQRASPRPARWKRDSRPSIPPCFGIEKKGDAFQLWVSWQGEPIHPEGAPVPFKTSGPFYVGIGFTSHLPATPLTAKVTDVVLENAPEKSASF